MVALYVITRISDNVASWKVHTPSPETAAASASLSPTATPVLSAGPSASPALPPTPQNLAAAQEYARILTPPPDDQKILALWKLTQSPDWNPEAAGTDPLPLAQEIARRGAAYYTASNFAQAASHVQILLRWTIRLLTSPATAPEGGRQLELARIAIATAATCPNTLLYPAIQAELKTLSEAIGNRPPPTVEELIARYADPLAAKDTGSWRMFANKNVLRSLLLDYVTTPPEQQNLKKMKTRVNLKSIIMLCPRTIELFHICLAGLDGKDSDGDAIKEEIKSLLRAPAPTPVPALAPQLVPAT